MRESRPNFGSDRGGFECTRAVTEAGRVRTLRSVGATQQLKDSLVFPFGDHPEKPPLPSFLVRAGQKPTRARRHGRLIDR